MLRNLVRSAGLRFALLATMAFMISIGVIGWLTVRMVAAALEQQAQQLVENEAGALLDEFKAGGWPDLEAALRGRFANTFVHIRYAVIERDGRVRLGDDSLVSYSRAAATAGRSVHAGGPRIATRALDDGSRIVWPMISRACERSRPW